MLLNLLDGPPKGSTHTIKLDGREWLEVKNDGPVPDEACEFRNVRREVYIDVVARLSELWGLAILDVDVIDTYRVSRQKFEYSLEVTTEIGRNEFADVWFLLDVNTECCVL